jgi:hypothetical protein
MEKTEEKKQTGYAFNYIADVGAGQQFQITGSFPVNVDEDTVRQEFKKFRNVIEENRRLSKIPDLKRDIGKAEDATRVAREEIAKLDAKKDSLKKGERLTTQESQARVQLLAQLEHEEHLTARARKELKQLEIEAGLTKE